MRKALFKIITRERENRTQDEKRPLTESLLKGKELLEQVQIVKIQSTSGLEWGLWAAEFHCLSDVYHLISQRFPLS